MPISKPSTGAVDTRVDWMLSTDTFIAPSIVYPSALLDVDSSGVLTPFVLSGSTPIQSWQVSSGTLPPEFTLDALTGELNYVTTSSTGSGTFGITASNPVGVSDTFLINWEIRESQGAAEFFNTLSKYPFLRISTSNSVENQVLLKQAFYGRTQSTGNGTLIEDTAFPIYVGSNGNNTWNYLIQVTGYSYWMFYANSTTDPATLANGLVTDMKTTLSYDLVAPVSADVVVDGINFPSDRSDIHWGSGIRYIDFGNDASLNGVMTDSDSWSFGFRLQEDWKPDGMGRGLFTREGRNWLAIAYGHSGTYSEMMFGNGASRTYDSSESTSLPSGGFVAGSFVRVTFDGSTTRFYVDGVLYYDYGTSFYWDGVSANSLNLQFSNSTSANTDFASYSYEHTKWQGLIDRLWISAGSVITTDDTGAAYPTGTTHAWDLTETIGSVFAPSIGTVSGVGVNAL
ncbi:hypothetical protein VPH526E571_0006 [Vibrio phage 526E57-1]